MPVMRRFSRHGGCVRKERLPRTVPPGAARSRCNHILRCRRMDQNELRDALSRPVGLGARTEVM